jgi:hypothetical protein
MYLSAFLTTPGKSLIGLKKNMCKPELVIFRLNTTLPQGNDLSIHSVMPIKIRVTVISTLILACLTSILHCIGTSSSNFLLHSRCIFSSWSWFYLSGVNMLPSTNQWGSILGYFLKILRRSFEFLPKRMQTWSCQWLSCHHEERAFQKGKSQHIR